MRGPGGITRRGFASLAAGALASLLLPLGGCGASPAGDPGDAWRVIGSNGEWVGTARFSDADEYGFASNGLAAVEDAGTGLWGFVDETGSWAIEPRYADAWSFYDNGTTQVLDESGHDIVWLDGEGNVVEDTTAVRRWARKDDGTGLYGIAAAGGDWLCEPAFSYLQTDRYSDYLLARPQGSDLCGVVDAGGGWVVEPAFADLVIAFDADVLAAEDADTGLWGYVGWDGDWVVQPAFAEATRMGDGRRALARMP